MTDKIKKPNWEAYGRQFKALTAERDKLLAENANLRDVTEDAIRVLKAIRTALEEAEK
jgi:hypothetical protein